MPRARFQNTAFRSAFIKKILFNVNFNHITSVLWEEKQKRSAYIYRLNTKIDLIMLCSSGFELYSRWVPLCEFECYSRS